MHIQKIYPVPAFFKFQIELCQVVKEKKQSTKLCNWKLKLSCSILQLDLTDLIMLGFISKMFYQTSLTH